ncbi:MAG: SOS response-associated peptidase [Chloroflexi bacterium]|nr:SOS response-associated peptidase [Chloroflexota bacterium]
MSISTLLEVRVGVIYNPIMCGRFVQQHDLDAIWSRFDVHGEHFAYLPREQFYPTNDILAVTQDGADRAGLMMHWGFLPVWSKRPLINAQTEKLATSNVWKRAFPSHRCLIVADGFYEWRKELDGSKTMMRIGLPSGEPFAMAGLWGNFKNKKDEWVQCATIITCPPNDLMQHIHNRMPVMLSREAEALWLDPMSQDRDVLGKVLVPYAAEEMVAREFKAA